MINPVLTYLHSQIVFTLIKQEAQRAPSEGFNTAHFPLSNLGCIEGHG